MRYPDRLAFRGRGEQDSRSAVESAVTMMRRPLLMGAMVDATDPEMVLNQSIAWDPSDGPSLRYPKRHPVPFGEYIPFRSVLAPISPRLSQIPETWCLAGPACRWRSPVPGRPWPSASTLRSTT